MAVLERPTEAPVRPLVEIADGKMRLNFHAGQRRAWQSDALIVLVLAGTQSGKTSFGPHWLYREIKRRGPGDYMVVTPTFPLLELKALPEFRRLFETTLKLGRYVASPSKRFIFSESGALRTFGHYDPMNPTQVLFGHAQDPESLESATAKAAWIDEGGQKKFKIGSFEAIRRRLSLAMGRILITTTPYDLGWLKQRIYDPWQRALREGHPHAEIDVIRFDSTENPAFPAAEFERARRELPGWKFDLFYRAIFTRPAGMVYDSFDETKHTTKRFEVPDDWPRYLGLDFGPVHTAAVLLAAKPNTRQLFVYRDYLAGGISTKQHVAALLRGEPTDSEGRVRLPRAYGGAASEDEWRFDFLVAGLPVGKPAVSAVDVGITRVYAAHRRDEIIAFDDLSLYLSQKLSYSYETDEAGEPLGTGAIEDKHDFHVLDAERYVVSTLRDGPPAGSQLARPITRTGRSDETLEGPRSTSVFGNSVRAARPIRRG